MLKQGWNIVLAGALVLLVSACASKLTSDVVSFHEGDLPDGEKIAVVPLDEAKQKSLEFQHYAELIEQSLKKMGYVPVENPDDAELLARVDYSVSEGRVETRTRMEPPRGYAHYHFYYGRYYDPFYFGYYDRWTPDIRSYTVYDRTLEMNILNADSDEVVFEGRVRSTGRENEIAEIMPYLVTAMFTNFPGESGVTKVVTIEKDR